MGKAKRYGAIDFTQIKPEHVQRIIKDLYATHHAEKRDFHFGQVVDRRQADRRRQDQAVLLDTRTSQSRRRSAGRRTQDENPDNKHKVGIDYYV